MSSRSSCLTVALIAQLRQAYSQKRLTFFVSKRLSIVKLIPLLSFLRANGVISHYERNLSSPASPSSGRGQGRLQVYLRYARGVARVSLWALPSTSPHTHRCSFQTVLQLASSSGAKLALSTNLGLMTLEDCVAQKQGGVLLFAFSVR